VSTIDLGSWHVLTSLVSGDVFLHNVVATFNLQQNTTTLTQRQKY
jgi:hypothetical protein